MVPENLVALCPEWFQTNTSRKCIWGIQFRSLVFFRVVDLFKVESELSLIDRIQCKKTKHVYKSSINSLVPLYPTTEMTSYHLFRKL